MNAVLKKLGLKTQSPVLILNAPEEYKEVLSEIEGEVHTSISGKYGFIQVFVKSLEEAMASAKDVVEALEEDGYLWLCYPKGTSKNYKSDINRDKAWQVFSPFEFEPVSLAAINEDWSALRFKDVNNIKVMKRKTAATEKGLERIKEGK